MKKITKKIMELKFLKPNIKNKLILNKNINKLVIVELTPTKFKILVINKSSIKKIV